MHVFFWRKRERDGDVLVSVFLISWLVHLISCTCSRKKRKKPKKSSLGDSFFITFPFQHPSTISKWGYHMLAPCYTWNSLLHAFSLPEPLGPPFDYCQPCLRIKFSYRCQNNLFYRKVSKQQQKLRDCPLSPSLWFEFLIN